MLYNLTCDQMIQNTHIENPLILCQLGDKYTYMNYNYGYLNHKKIFTLYFLERLDFIHNRHVLQSQ